MNKNRNNISENNLSALDHHQPAITPVGDADQGTNKVRFDKVSTQHHISDICSSLCDVITAIGVFKRSVEKGTIREQYIESIGIIEELISEALTEIEFSLKQINSEVDRIPLNTITGRGHGWS